MKRIDFYKLDVEDFLNELGLRNVRRDGNEIIFSCPFPGHSHGDSTPSASMQKGTTVTHCFTCGFSGNAVTFLAEYENISPFAASRKIRQIIGDDFRNPNGDLYTELFLKEENKNILLRVAPTEEDLFYRDLDWKLISELRAPFEFKYLLKRGFSWQILSSFRIGWDIISNRLTIPYFDEQNNIIGFKGRTPYKDIKPRYKVLGGVEYGFDTFDVSKTLFNISKVIQGKPLIVCEGELNCMKMVQVGYQNVVSISGQFISDEQAYLITKLCDKCILIFDDYEKARQAAEKLVYKIKVKIVDEHELDPADMNVLQLEQLVDSAKSAII